VKIKIEDIKDSQKLIKIELSPEKVNEAVSGVYTDIQKKARVPGYRQGKAPLDILKARYERSASEEAVNNLIWDSYRQAASENNINPVGYPVVSDVVFNPGAPLTFTVKVDVMPEFKLKQYKDIKVSEKPFEVSDDDINKSLEELRESMAEYRNVNRRLVSKGDYVVGRYECFENGKLVDKKDKLWLYISDKLEPKELLAALLGSEVSKEVQAQASYPDNYEYKELAGKSRLYKVTPLEIKEKILPEANDELAKAAGNFNDLSALKKALRESIQRAKENEARHALEAQICAHLLKTHSFDVPVSMIERRLEQLIQNAAQRLAYQGYKKQDIDSQKDKLKESFKEQAVKDVRLFLIIEKISSCEKIEASGSDVAAKIKDIADSSKENVEEVNRRINENGLIDSLKEQIVHEKVMDFLVNSANKC
jgi:trigger factor